MSEMDDDDEHDYNSEHLEPICESCFEFKQQWTHTAAALNAFRSAVGQLNQIAAQHFINDRTELSQRVKANCEADDHRAG